MKRTKRGSGAGTLIAAALWAGTSFSCGAVQSAPHELTNGAMRIRFADVRDGFAVTAIENRLADRARFVTPDAETDGFWALNLKAGGPAGRESARVTNRSKRESCACEKLDTGLRFVWKGVDLPGEPGVLDVTADVTLASDGVSLWTLNVDNRSVKWALYETEYPCLSRVQGKDEGSVLVPSWNLGARVVPNVMPRSFANLSSPPMVTAFNQGDAGLYYAARDGEGRIKTLVFKGEHSVFFRTLVENAGVVGKAATGPKYPVAIGVYRGDWWGAARLHRGWALRQKWTSRGRLADTDRYQRRMNEIPLWLNIHGGAAAVSNALTRAHELYPDFATGIHWHLWQHSPHDVNYPEYFPEQPGVKDAIACLNGLGQVPMIYVNGRRWSEHMQGFLLAKGYASLNAAGQVNSTWFKPAPPLASMCPACPQWHAVVSNLAHRVLAELKAPAIFIDEVGNEPAKPCFNPAHGHPLGGGAYWTEGNVKELEAVHREYLPAGAVLTTEGSSEVLMSSVDGYLTVAGRSVEDVPWYTAVYSGYATYFGSPSHVSDDVPSFWALQARELLWGVETGWFYPETLEDPAKAEMIGRLCRFRRDHIDWFGYGTFLGEPRPKDPVPEVEVLFHGRATAPKQASDADAPRKRTPGVRTALWTHAKTGEKRLFAANLTSRPQRVRCDVDGQEVALELGPYGLGEGPSSHREGTDSTGLSSCR